MHQQELKLDYPEYQFKSQKASILKPTGYRFTQQQIDKKIKKTLDNQDHFSKISTQLEQERDWKLQMEENFKQPVHKQKQNLRNNFQKFKQIEDENYEYDQHEIFEKLGIEPENPDQINNNHYNTSKYLGHKLGGIDDKYFNSTKIPQVRSKVTGELVDDIEKEIELIRERRNLLLSKGNFQSKQSEPYQYYAEDQKKKMQNQIDQVYQPDDIDDVITFQWKNNEPSLEEVESRINRHRQYLISLQSKPDFKYTDFLSEQQNQGQNFESQEERRKFLFLQNNESQKMVNAIIRPNEEELLQVHRDILQYGGYDKDEMIKQLYLKDQLKKMEEEQNDFDQKNGKFDKIQPRYMQESRRQREKRILQEELAEIEERMNQEALQHFQNGTKPRSYGLGKSGNTKKNKNVEFQQKYQNYELDKDVQGIIGNKQKETLKPNFDRFNKQETFNKQQQQKKEQQKILDIDVPRPKTLEERQKADVVKGMDYLENDEKGSKIEQYLNQLYKKIIDQKVVYEKQKTLHDEEFILKYLFLQIDLSKINYVQKHEIYDRVNSDENVVKYFDIIQSTLYNDLDKFKTQRIGLFDFQDFSKFMRTQKLISLKSQSQDKVQQEKIRSEELKQKELEKLEQDPENLQYFDGMCVLPENIVDLLREGFIEVDKYDDYIVKREYFINHLLQSIKLKKHLKRPATKDEVTQKIVNIQEILENILLQQEMSYGDEKIGLEYITWNQFYDYFKNYDFQLIKNLKQQKQQKLIQGLSNQEKKDFEKQEINLFDINKNDLEIIKDLFDMMGHVRNDYVNIEDFFLSCKSDFQFQSIAQNFSRGHSEETGLEQETIEQTMDRILCEADTYVTWDEMHKFFSRRGRPVDLEEEEAQRRIQKLLERPQNEKGFALQGVDLNTIYNKSQKIDLQEQNQNNYENENLKPKIKSNIISVCEIEENEEFNFEIMKYDDAYRYKFIEDFEHNLSKVCRIQKEEVEVQRIMCGSVALIYQINQGNRILNVAEQEKIKKCYPDLKMIFLKQQKIDEKKEALIKNEDGIWIEPPKTQFQEDEDFFEIKKFEYEPFDIDQIRKMKFDIYNNKQNKKSTKQEEEYNKIMGKYPQKDYEQLTVPQPFSIDKRQQELGTTIRQQKFQQMVQELTQKEEDLLNHRFRANKVPIETKIPMYDNLVSKQKEKREIMHQNSLKMTLENQKPFTFYERDMWKKRHKIQELNQKVEYEVKKLKHIQFKAKEAPITSKIELLPQLEKEKKIKTQKNKEKRLKELEKERESIQKKNCTRILLQEIEYKEKLKVKLNQKTHEEENHCTFKPKINPYEFDKSRTKISRNSAGHTVYKAPGKQTDYAYFNEENKPPPKLTKLQYVCDYCGKTLKREVDPYKNLEKEKEENYPAFSCKICDEEGQEGDACYRCNCCGDDFKNSFDVCIACYGKKDGRMKRDRLKKPEGIKKEERTLEDLEEQFECVRLGKLYEKTQSKNMTAEEINLLNRLRKQKKDEEEMRKRIIAEEKKKNEKENIKKINQERAKQEKEQKKERDQKIQEKIDKQGPMMGKKSHGSSVLGNLKEKAKLRSMANSRQSQQTQKSQEKTEEEIAQEQKQLQEQEEKEKQERIAQLRKQQEEAKKQAQEQDQQLQREREEMELKYLQEQEEQEEVERKKKELEEKERKEKAEREKKEKELEIQRRKEEEEKKKKEQEEKDKKEQERQKQLQQQKEKELQEKKQKEEQEKKKKLEEQQKIEKENQEKERLKQLEKEKEDKKRQEQEKLQEQKKIEEKERIQKIEREKKEQREQEEKQRLQNLEKEKKELERIENQNKEMHDEDDNEIEQNKNEEEENQNENQDEDQNQDQENEDKQEDQENENENENQDNEEENQDEDQEQEQEEQKKKEEEKKKEEQLKLKQQQQEDEKQRQEQEQEEERKKLSEKDRKLKELQEKQKEKNKTLQHQDKEKNEKTVEVVKGYILNRKTDSKFNKIEASGKNHFVDKFFPHNDTSLTKDPSDFQIVKEEHCWARAEKCIGGDYDVFYDKIESSDILQGSLGDCYFLSSLSAIAEKNEDLIRRLFETQYKSEDGKYIVWLCYDGEWTQIVLDDYFVCKGNSSNQNVKPLFSKANGNELWVLLLEKAYAKVYGNFHKIEAGLTHQALRDLTGASGIYFETKPENQEQVWDFISKNLQKKYILTAGTQKDERGQEFQKETGIVGGHAYAILDARQLTSAQGKTDRCIKLRNPWGAHEWNGEWSDKSNQWTDKVKKEVGLQDIDDGIFWMKLEDYVQEYGSTSCNMLHSDYFYTSKIVKIPADKQIQFTFEINQQTHGFLSLNQKDRRNFMTESNEKEYIYSVAKFMLVKQNSSGEYKQMCTRSGIDRNVFNECNLEVGKYILIVDVSWRQKITDELVISFYSSNKQINLEKFTGQEINDDLYSDIFDQIIMQQKPEKQSQIEEGIMNYKGLISGIVYFWYENKTSNKTLNVNFELETKDKMETLAKGFGKQERKIQFKVEPNQSKIIKFKTFGAYGYSQGQSYQVETKMSEQELIKQIKQNSKEKKERGQNTNIFNYFVYLEGKFYLFWENLSKTKLLKEEIDFQLKGLKGQDFDASQTVKIEVKPQENKILVLINNGETQMGIQYQSKNIKIEEYKEQGTVNNDAEEDEDEQIEEDYDDDFEDE